MRLDWPIGLLALLLVPLAVAGYVWIEKRRARYAIHYTNIEVLASVVTRGSRWRGLVPVALVLLALTSALAAVSRPQANVAVGSEQASIALAIDMSGSMAAEDVKPTRLGAAEEAVRRFLKDVPKKYRVGLVTFAVDSYIAAPLTNDRNMVLQALLYNNIPRQGTAIGDALARAVELLHPVAADGSGGATTSTGPAPADPHRPLSAIVLLSDGAQTSGVLAPLDGAARAKSFGIPVYTVALGTPDGVITRGGFSRPVPPDPTTLRLIAKTTGGEFFEIRNQTRLNAVYEDLASRLGHTKQWHELSFILVGLAALFALGAGAASLLWGQRLP
jgi:Ca-activated chloride channel family protein